MIQTGLAESEMGMVVESGASDDGPIATESSLESCGGDVEAVPVAVTGVSDDKTSFDASSVVESIVESWIGSASAASPDGRDIPWVEEVATDVEVFWGWVGECDSTAPSVDVFRSLISTAFLPP